MPCLQSVWGGDKPKMQLGALGQARSVMPVDAALNATALNYLDCVLLFIAQILITPN